MSSQYRDGEDWKGKRALVIGTGNSGHDIAQDLHSSGAQVTLVQRSPTLVVNIEPSAQLAYALYDEGPADRGLRPDRDLDAVRAGAQEPHRADRAGHEARQAAARRAGRAAASSSTSATTGSGWQFKYLTRGGGYYFNVGCSDLVAEGKIGLAQFADIEGFVADGARLRERRDDRRRSRRAGDRLQGPGAPGAQAVRRRGGASASGRSGASATSQELRNMYVAHAAARASGSSPAAWRSAASIRNIWRCRSRRGSSAWRAERERRNGSMSFDMPQRGDCLCLFSRGG